MRLHGLREFIIFVKIIVCNFITILSKINIVITSRGTESSVNE